MKRLLAADLYSLSKSKMAYIGLALAFGLPLMTVLLYVGLRALVEATGDATMALFTGDYIVSSAFALGEDITIILVLFVGILSSSDQSSGTLRGKIVVGHSRAAVFFSRYLVSLLYCLIVSLLYAASMTGFSALFFGFGSSHTATDFLYLYVLGILGFLFLGATTTSLALLFKSPAPAILIGMLVGIAFGLIASLLHMIDYSSFDFLAQLIPSFTILDFGSGITLAHFFEGVVSYLIVGTGFTLLGYLVFRRKEIR